MKKPKINLFLDSGAFSAWTQGTKIDVQEYIKFIKKHQDIIGIYANLDVIGLGGKQPNQLTAEKTLENQKIMEAAGLSPLPCFHYGEPLSFLEYYVKNYDYIALGVAGNSGAKLIPWLDSCFSKYICDNTGFPKVKVHGFAITSVPLMLRYPWYSVDSTSWALIGGMGSIYVPKYKNKVWVYDENVLKIAVSSQNPKKKEAGQHIDTLTPYLRRIYIHYIHEKGYKLGKSEFKQEKQSYALAENERWVEKKSKKSLRLVEILVEEGLCNRYQLRDELNIIYFKDLEKTIPKWPWCFETKNIMEGLL
ncbi:MAG: hypothetical protein ACLFVR_15020 [Thiohalospira sp.]